jgi:hypothetical protein
MFYAKRYGTVWLNFVREYTSPLNVAVVKRSVHPALVQDMNRVVWVKSDCAAQDAFVGNHLTVSNQAVDHLLNWIPPPLLTKRRHFAGSN